MLSTRNWTKTRFFESVSSLSLQLPGTCGDSSLWLYHVFWTLAVSSASKEALLCQAPLQRCNLSTFAIFRVCVSWVCARLSWPWLLLAFEMLILVWFVSRCCAKLKLSVHRSTAVLKFIRNLTKSKMIVLLLFLHFLTFSHSCFGFALSTSNILRNGIGLTGWMSRRAFASW